MPHKTQLIRFSPMPSSSCSVKLSFCGQQLLFVDTVIHLGHLLRYDLSDSEDISDKLRSMVRKANCLFDSFPRVGSLICRVSSILLPLSLWFLSLVTFFSLSPKHWSNLQQDSSSHLAPPKSLSHWNLAPCSGSRQYFQCCFLAI